MARMMGELVRRYPADGPMVSTGNHLDAPDVDNHMGSRVDRLALPSRRLRTVQGLASWTLPCRRPHPFYSSRVVWCGHFKPATYPEIYMGVSRPVELMIAGFGISLSEAGCGLPVISGQSGGIPDAVRDGETGLLVYATSADAVRLLLRDRDLAQRLGVGGRKVVESFFNWDRVTQDVLGIAEEYALR